MKYDKKLFELSQEVYSKSKNTTDKEIKQKQKMKMICLKCASKVNFGVNQMKDMI